MSTFFINGKPAFIKDLRKLRYPPSWLVLFLVVPLIKFLDFSEDLITFTISFIWLFVRIIPEPVIDEVPLLTFLQVILSPVFTRRLSFNFLIPVFFNSLPYEFFIEFANDIISLIGIG